MVSIVSTRKVKRQKYESSTGCELDNLSFVPVWGDREWELGLKNVEWKRSDHSANEPADAGKWGNA
jgi:hypothetical protein